MSANEQKTSRELAIIAAQAADEKKATDILVQDVAELVALDAKGKPVTIGGAASLPVAKNVSKAAGDAPTKQEFVALVESLGAAGLMAAE